ncbi:hypothetical protein H4O20_07535 [Aequorivita sp. 609]|uniref:hypothetical protein n=1 Tax=Aequorivita TaxID=153265 RepID=UPI00161D467B|nr:MULTISPECIES: hypothetical protein [Aequorivita]MBB6681292.1 hypothetical protein [Aequorivita sp. 609]
MKNSMKIICLLFLSLLVSCSSDNEDTAPPQYTLDNIQGDWYRVGGNNPEYNGMLVNVVDNTGTVVNPASSTFNTGDIKWKTIVAKQNNTYDYKELGSDNNYYDATMKLGVDDTLRISVGNSGSGNVQKWVRQIIDTEANDCLPYDPTIFNGNFQGEWEEINEIDAFSIMSIPSHDVNGGIAAITVQTDAPVVPCFNLFAGDELSSALKTGNNGTQIRTYRVIGQPGTLFSGETTDCENAPSDQYPWQYTVSWSYESIIDCYEPNNSFEQAKAVPKNETISASGVAGHTNGGLGIYDPSTYDWYKITLNEATKLRLTLNECPSDIHMHFRIFQKNNNGGVSTISVDSEAISGELHAPGSTYYIQSRNILQPGEYLLEGHRLVGQGVPSVVADDELNPEHWSSPYTFVVTTED